MRSTARLDQRALDLRRAVVRTLGAGQRGHLGSALSVLDMLRCLYDSVLRHDPARPDWPERDRLILSKGHGCIALYVLLADQGYFPADTLEGFCAFDSCLGGHPECGKIPGVEASTGSLGHGLGLGLGMALAARLDNNGKGRDSRVFVILGDGESNEGSIWEAALMAGKHRLDNLCVLTDYNKLQSYGPTRLIQDLEPLADKWRAFNFEVFEVDGHDHEGLAEILNRPGAGRPRSVICHTVKGRGVAGAENEPTWHHRTKISAEVVEDLLRRIKPEPFDYPDEQPDGEGC